VVGNKFVGHDVSIEGGTMTVHEQVDGGGFSYHEYLGVKLATLKGDRYDNPDSLYRHCYEVDTVFRHTKKMDVLIDVGACCGITSAIALKFGLVKRAILIEPDPLNCAAARETLRINEISERRNEGEEGQAEILPGAAFDTGEGERPLHRMSSNSGAHTLFNYDLSKLKKSQRTILHSDLVFVNDLDRFVISNERCLVWVDAQGSEFNVLRGGKNLVRPGNFWYFEFAPSLFLDDDDRQEDPSLVGSSFDWMMIRKPARGDLLGPSIPANRFPVFYGGWQRGLVRHINVLLKTE